MLLGLWGFQGCRAQGFEFQGRGRKVVGEGCRVQELVFRTRIEKLELVWAVVHVLGLPTCGVNKAVFLQSLRLFVSLRQPGHFNVVSAVALQSLRPNW